PLQVLDDGVEPWLQLGVEDTDTARTRAGDRERYVSMARGRENEGNEIRHADASLALRFIRPRREWVAGAVGPPMHHETGPTDLCRRTSSRRRSRRTKRQVPLRALRLGPGKTSADRLLTFTLARRGVRAHSRLPASKAADHLQTRGSSAARSASAR